MEKKLPDHDPLEEYIRRTFDDLDEEPSAEMWLRIEAELRPADRKPVGLALFFRQNRWLMAACLAGLLAGGVFGWQLCSLSKTGNSAGPAAEILIEKPAGPAENSVEKVASNSSKTAVAEQSKSPISAGKSALPAANFQSNSTVGNVNSPSISTPVFENLNDEKAAVFSERDSKINQNELPATQNGLSENQKLPTEIQADGSKTANSSPVLTRFSMLELCSTKQPFAVFSTQNTAPIFGKIQPEFLAQKPASFFVAAWLMPVRTHERVRGAAQPIRLRPLFVNRPKTESVSVEFGLSVGKKWGNGFVFETGLSLRSERSRATHEAQFRFSQSTAGQAGNRQFDYDLTTYGGSASVSYRVEEVNPASPIGPTEPVLLQISTIERVKMARVPLLFGFQKQVGRWQFGLKTGPVAQFLLKNELEIESASSAHPRLRPLAGRLAWAIVSEKPQRFRAGFQAAGNVGFRVSEKIGLTLEPTFMGDFGRRVASTGRLPERFSTGLKLGAMVWF